MNILKLVNNIKQFFESYLSLVHYFLKPAYLFIFIFLLDLLGLFLFSYTFLYLINGVINDNNTKAFLPSVFFGEYDFSFYEIISIFIISMLLIYFSKWFYFRRIEYFILSCMNQLNQIAEKNIKKSITVVNFYEAHARRVFRVLIISYNLYKNIIFLFIALTGTLIINFKLFTMMCLFLSFFIMLLAILNKAAFRLSTKLDSFKALNKSYISDMKKKIRLFSNRILILDLSKIVSLSLLLLIIISYLLIFNNNLIEDHLVFSLLFILFVRSIQVIYVCTTSISRFFNSIQIFLLPKKNKFNIQNFIKIKNKSLLNEEDL